MCNLQRCFGPHEADVGMGKTSNVKCARVIAGRLVTKLVVGHDGMTSTVRLAGLSTLDKHQVNMWSLIGELYETTEDRALWLYVQNGYLEVCV